MIDFNDLTQTNGKLVEEMKEKKKQGPSKLKGFVSLIAAGMIGSALTLNIAPHSDYFLKQMNSKGENGILDNPENDSSQSSSTILTQTSVKPSQTMFSIADIVEGASKAVVGIGNMQHHSNYFSQNTESVQSGFGSGVIFRLVEGTAYIVTNNHVIEGATEIEVSLFNGEKTTAKLVGADALMDLAVLKINSKYATTIMEFGDSSQLRPGEQVLAIGNPLGLDLSRTVTQGIVSAINRSVPVSTSAGEWELSVIQTDAAINPGNSGGALINTKGQVIGINSLKISEKGVEGLGFAIPSNVLLPIVNEMIEKGKVERPYIGVSLANLEEVPRKYLQSLPNSVEHGAVITYIDANSAAEKAGLKEADVIISVNDEEIMASSDVRKYLYSNLKVGDQITLKLYREGKLLSVQLKLTSNYTLD